MKTGKQRKLNRQWRQMLPKMWKKKIIEDALSNSQFVNTILEASRKSGDEARTEGSTVSFKKYGDAP